MIGVAFGLTLARARAGDEAAFARIFRDINPALVRYLRVMAAEAADDVAGDTWLQVVAGLGGFRGGERAFRAWLFTIARHRAVDWARLQARCQTVPLACAGQADQPTSPDAADVALERISTHAAIELIGTLPDDQAEILMLRVLAGLHADDVARIVGKSPGAVRVAAHRALRRLASGSVPLAPGLVAVPGPHHPWWICDPSTSFRDGMRCQRWTRSSACGRSAARTRP